VRTGRAVSVAALALAAVALPAVAGASARGGAGAPGTLELFVHPRGGGAWSSRALTGVPAGVGAPSVVASRGGALAVAERLASGDVLVAQGRLAGPFTTTDLTVATGAPPAVGGPVASVASDGTVSVWYRTSLDHLEVVTQVTPRGGFVAADVTQATGTAPLLGDPSVATLHGAQTGYAVTMPGTVTAFTPPAEGAPWGARDPTGGLSYPPLAGGVAVFAAPGLPAATVLLGIEPTGDLLELTDGAAGRPPTVGAWTATDLTAIGVPAPLGPLESAGGTLPDAAYRTWGGDVVALTLTAAIPGAVSFEDLTRVSDLVGARGALPAVLDAPGGPAVGERTMTGDLQLATIRTPTVVHDVSFEPHTEELIAGDVGATTVGAGAMVLVAEDGGAIAPTRLERRIAMIAASFDQQHRGFQDLPAGSYCNPFTASFGRGWRSGCRRGYAAEEWCSDFAQFVWRAAGIDTAGITGWSATFVTWGEKHHRVRFGPNAPARVGDAIVWGQRAPLYGQHVGIVVSVEGRYLDVVSGDSGGDFPRYGIGVWRWGAFEEATSSVLGYRVLAVVQP